MDRFKFNHLPSNLFTWIREFNLKSQRRALGALKPTVISAALCHNFIYLDRLRRKSAFFVKTELRKVFLIMFKCSEWEYLKCGSSWLKQNFR